MTKAVQFDQEEAVVSDDATVDTVITEETVIQADTTTDIIEEPADELPVEMVEDVQFIEEEIPDEMVEQPAIEEVVEQPFLELANQEVAKEEVQTDEVPENRYVIKIGENLWLRSWFSTCTEIERAIVLDDKWADAHLRRLSFIKGIKGEIVKL
jgi:ABC-type proline/glycine betaine transport system ATPase subunit